MNLKYQISTGQLTDDDGTLIATGFSGNNSRAGVNPDHIQGMNNPDMVSVHNIGPLPPGLYRVGPWGDHPPVGPNSAALTQIGGETYGRSGFFVHGPGGEDPGNSSEGCIVISHDERVKVIGMSPTTITVVV